VSRTYEVVAVKHNERNNGRRCAAYWSIESDPECERSNDHEIYDHWFCGKLPKRILSVLETAKTDPEGYGLKRGMFIVVLKEGIRFEDYGCVGDFKSVESITGGLV